MMAVISITDVAKIEFYKNGKAGASVVVGYEGERRRCARYEFTVPVPGASSITAQINGPHFVEDGGREAPVRFYIGTDPDSHVNAGPDSPYTGVATVDSDKRTVTLAADIILVPDKTYYLWFFPSVDYWGWYYWSRNCTITTYGGSSSQPTVSASSVEFGKQVTIYTNRATSFTHKLEVKFGSSKTTIAQNVTDSYKWTPSEELARQIPNDTEGTATIICTTYNGSEQVGDPMETTVLLKVPSTMVPTATATWTDKSGAYDAVGTLAQNVSKLEVKVTGSGAYGSTIKSATVKLDGKTYSGAVLTEKGSRKLTVTVKDSRGKTGSKEYTITVSQYAVPALTLSAHRCQEDGTADDFGEFCEITAKGSVTSIGTGNTATLTVDYGSTPETQEVTPSGFTWSKIVPVPSTTTRKITATLADKLKSTPRDMVLSVGYATMDFLDGGKGIAFGATATQEGFTCAMPAQFTGGVTGITAAMVGAAPAGYGLGEAGKWADDLNNATANGFYSWTDTAANKPFNYGNLLVLRRGGDRTTQIGIDPYMSGYGQIAVRHGNSNGWYDWMYLNPPMMLGVEYPTVERYRGKRVYTKAIDFGSMPNASVKSVSHNIANLGACISAVGTTSDGSTFGYFFPLYNSNTANGQVGIYVTKSATQVSATVNWSSYNATIILKYTKTTD
jgi:hypothetical protein